MKIGIPKEIRAHETRVALTPSAVPQLLKDGHEVLIKAGLNLLEPQVLCDGEDGTLVPFLWILAPKSR
jgi:hypothetical protein